MAVLKSLRPSHLQLLDGGALAVLVLVALVGFRSSYGGAEFFVVGTIATLLGLLVCHVVAATKPPLLVGLAVILLVFVLVGGVVALSDRAIAGVIPSGGTIVGAVRTAVYGWKELITTNPPVGGTGTLMVLPFLCGYAASVIGLLLMRSRRLHVTAILPAGIVLGISIVTGVREPVAPVVQGGLFGAVAIGWLAVRQNRERPRLPGHSLNVNRLLTAVATVGVCTAAGWYVAPSLPKADDTVRTVWRQTVTPPFDPREYPSPLSEYRHYVKDDKVKDAVMFTIEGLPEGVKVRLATMDSYDGLVWRPSYSADLPTTQNSGYFERMGSDIPADFGGEVATLTVTIGAYDDVWVPDVGEVLSLHFEGGTRDDALNEALRYNRATDTAASRTPLREGDRYVMTVRLPTNMEKLANVEIVPDPHGSVTGSPPTLDKWAATPDILSMKDIGTRIDALRTRLVTDGAYSDGDKGQAQAPSDAGHSAFRMNSFVEIEPMRGNAEQYASALALMLRGLDRVPTRVVMGFEPDAASFEPGADAAIAVTGRQVEAWVEVPVAGVGWVAVVPTPERSETALKAKSPSPPQPDYQTQAPPAPPLLDPEFDSPATTKTGAKDTRPPEPDKPPAEAPAPSETAAGDSGVSLLATSVVGGPPLVLLLVIAAILFAKSRRRRRRRRVGAAHERVANGWREVTDRALDMGRPIPDMATRREAAQFVGVSTVVLAERADAAVFGADEPSEEAVEQYWAELEKQLSTMRRELGVVNRVKAAVSLTSLRRSSRRRSKREQRQRQR